MNYSDLGAAAFITRLRVVPLRNMGAAISPFNSFLVLQGLESLPLRMERHCSNALQVAHYLEGHDQVTWVRYAGLPDHPHHDRVQRYMRGQASGILSFGIKGGIEAGTRSREVHRRAEADRSPGEHRRCQVARLPPGVHHPPPARPPSPWQRRE